MRLGMHAIFMCCVGPHAVRGALAEIGAHAQTCARNTHLRKTVRLWFLRHRRYNARRSMFLRRRRYEYSSCCVTVIVSHVCPQQHLHCCHRYSVRLPLLYYHRLPHHHDHLIAPMPKAPPSSSPALPSHHHHHNHVHCHRCDK